MLATLISKAYTFPEMFDADIISDDTEKLLMDEVEQQLLCKNFDYSANDSFPDILAIANDIIEWCRVKNDYYLYRALLCRLDTMINLDDIIDTYDINLPCYSKEDNTDSFISLNDNFNETKIFILPKVKSLKSYSLYKSGTTPNPRLNAHTWLDDLNNRIHNIYAVTLDSLCGFTPINVICSIPEIKLEKECIKIGITPVCNMHVDELLEFDYLTEKSSTSKHKGQFFQLKNILCENEIEKRIINSFNLACNEECDIFIAPEMLATNKLVSVDDQGYNGLYSPNQSNNYTTPTLTLPPTRWENKSNILSIFNNKGKLIAKQHKQHRFTAKTKDGLKWKEYLENTNKTITIIHIPGWGRFCFPICIDYLVERYRHIMTEVLKANFLLCPSFSFGEYNFNLSGDAEIEFEVRTVWVNSCSAIGEFKNSIDAVGIVSTPIVSTDRIQKITTNCLGKCNQPCLFILKIPTNSYNQEQNVNITHYYNH